MVSAISSFVCFLSVCLLSDSTAVKRYDGDYLVEVQPQSSEEIKFVKNLLANELADVWHESHNGHVQVHLSADMNERVLGQLFDRDIVWELIHPDIQELVDMERDWIAMRRLERDNKMAFDYNNFNSYGDIQTELVDLAARCPANFVCEVFSIGQSYEGNELNTLKISKPSDPDRKLVWMESMMHAREWLAGATLMVIANHLISNYGNDTEVTELLDNYDFYMLPAINPDGYIYSWETERLWRKNRRPNAEDPNCPGTDLNRNYEFAWGGPGADTNPCSNTFRGESPASEPVTQALQAQMTAMASSTLAYVTLHTYGKLFMTQWAYTDDNGSCAYPADYENLIQVAQAAADAGNSAGDGGWVAGSWCDILYVSSGCSQDHAKGGAGITYSFTPELRGDGFIVPPTEIEPSFQEVWAATVAMIREIEVVESKDKN